MFTECDRNVPGMFADSSLKETYLGLHEHIQEVAFFEQRIDGGVGEDVGGGVAAQEFGVCAVEPEAHPPPSAQHVLKQLAVLEAHEILRDRDLEEQRYVTVREVILQSKR